MEKSSYIGRFAPSPTGKLHQGSLFAAFASYCDAMQNSGSWLLRIEDLDPPRESPGASESFIQTLKHYGFHFNADIVFQSNPKRQSAYQQALDELLKNKKVYYCTCSRKELLKTTATATEHRCREVYHQPEQAHSIKLKAIDKTLEFNDRIQGKYRKNLLLDCGDVVLKRKDGLFSYQLAVVVDDNYQKITDIVRGIDLIDSTPWQIYLNSLLGFKQPRYAHIPTLNNQQGQKLSKQTHAQEISNNNPLSSLLKIYAYFKLKPFAHQPKTLNQFWQHAISCWDVNKISKTTAILV